MPAPLCTSVLSFTEYLRRMDLCRTSARSARIRRRTMTIVCYITIAYHHHMQTSANKHISMRCVCVSCAHKFEPLSSIQNLQTASASAAAATAQQRKCKHTHARIAHAAQIVGQQTRCIVQSYKRALTHIYSILYYIVEGILVSTNAYLCVYAEPSAPQSYVSI